MRRTKNASCVPWNRQKGTRNSPPRCSASADQRCITSWTNMDWTKKTDRICLQMKIIRYLCGIFKRKAGDWEAIRRWYIDIRPQGVSDGNLENLIYNYLTICKWVVYEFCFWNKKQIRNKNGFLGKSSFFCLHYFSFLSLACNQSTNPSYYYAFSSWFNICFFIYPGIRSEKRKVLFSMIGINMCKVKNNHPSNQIFVYF